MTKVLCSEVATTPHHDDIFVDPIPHDAARVGDVEMLLERGGLQPIGDTYSIGFVVVSKIAIGF